MGQLRQVDVWLGRTTAPTSLLDPTTADHHPVTSIQYDAKGRRTLIAHGNQATTHYDYDPLTFRLTRLTTARPPIAGDDETVQDLAYAYDPVGTVVRITDTADIHGVIFFNNRRVEPTADYVYDAVYRLTSATGRELLGLAGTSLAPPTSSSATDSPRVGLPHPNNGDAVGRYEERFEYDDADNVAKLTHAARSGTSGR